MRKEGTNISQTLHNILYSLGANVLSTILGMVFTLIIPRYMNVEEYGYYQLYILYLTYCYILGWGWWDGIYLEIGGQFYEKLDKYSLRRQFQLLTIYSGVLYTIILGILLLYIKHPENRLVCVTVCVTGFINAMRIYLQYIIQATNRMKEYGMTIVVWRVIACIGGLVAIVCGVGNFAILILMDSLGRLVSLLYEIVKCKEIVLGKIGDLRTAFKEGKHAISRGYKLMISTMTGGLIIGLVRLEVENHWSILEFAKVTLVISLASVFINCINAIAVALFPMLRRLNEKNLADYYRAMGNMIIILWFGLMIFCTPMIYIVRWWLPQYADSLKYVPFLLPICVYECKNSVLGTTYLKTLGREKELLKINIYSIFIAILISSIAVYQMNSIEGAMLALVIVMGIRCIWAEKIVSKLLCIDCKKDIILENVLVGIFILSHTVMNKSKGMLVYGVCYLGFLIMMRKDIIELKYIFLRARSK